MKIKRVWAMPSRHTFTIQPISKLIESYAGIFVKNWVDPYCGFHSRADHKNDLNPGICHNPKEAVEYLKQFKSDMFDGGFFDPPYSFTQIKKCYHSIGIEQYNTKMTFYSDAKDELSRVVKPNGIVISCGWNSMGMGKSRGFEIIEILLVAHGGAKNDTIITVERKLENENKKRPI